MNESSKACTEGSDAKMPVVFKAIEVIKDKLRMDISTAKAIRSKLFGGVYGEKEKVEVDDRPEAPSFFSKLEDGLDAVNSLAVDLQCILDTINKEL